MIVFPRLLVDEDEDEDDEDEDDRAERVTHLPVLKTSGLSDIQPEGGDIRKERSTTIQHGGRQSHRGCRTAIER